jgi:F-type H+-transporting ATPase subunit delta
LQALASAARSDEFRVFLEHDRVPQASKQGLIDTTLKDIGPLARNLLGILAGRRLLDMLPLIAESFQDLLDAYYGRQRAEVTSAVPLEDAERQQVSEFIKSLESGKEIVLDARVDPSILGGLVVKVGSHLIDGSTRAKLAQLRRTLAQESIQAGA